MILDLVQEYKNHYTSLSNDFVLKLFNGIFPRVFRYVLAISKILPEQGFQVIFPPAPEARRPLWTKSPASWSFGVSPIQLPFPRLCPSWAPTEWIRSSRIPSMFSHFCSSLFSFRQIVSPEAQFIVIYYHQNIKSDEPLKQQKVTLTSLVSRQKLRKAQRWLWRTSPT